jgi:hypothetical protein
MTDLKRRYVRRKPGRRGLTWCDGDVTPFAAASTKVEQFKLGRLKPPRFAITDGEPGA